MITVGAQHAIGLLARTLLSRGDRALVESPTYPHASEALRHNGARLVPVAVTTDEGWDEMSLEQAFQRTSPTLGYLMPDWHNPTGRTMSPELRERTAAMAAAQGTTLIADETMGELGFADLRRDAPLTPPFAVAYDRLSASPNTPADVVITSYALAHRDIEDLRRPKWHRLAVDEGREPADRAIGLQSLHAPETLRCR